MKKKAYLVMEIKYGIFTRTPIYVIDIVEDHIYAAKCDYRAKGYKGLTFSALLRHIEFE